jgi:hypothetical protein
MAKKDKDATNSEPQETAAPAEPETAIEPQAAQEPEAGPVAVSAGVTGNAAPLASALPAAPGKIRATNTSATLLHLDDGTPFPPRATAELTQAEALRFSRHRLIVKQK